MSARSGSGGGLRVGVPASAGLRAGGHNLRRTARESRPTDPTSGSESRRRLSAVCSVSGFRGLNEGDASWAVGSDRDDASSGGVFEGKTVASAPAGWVTSTPEVVAEA